MSAACLHFPPWKVAPLSGEILMSWRLSLLPVTTKQLQSHKLLLRRLRRWNRKSSPHCQQLCYNRSATPACRHIHPCPAGAWIWQTCGTAGIKLSHPETRGATHSVATTGNFNRPRKKHTHFQHTETHNSHNPNLRSQTTNSRTT